VSLEELREKSDKEWLGVTNPGKPQIFVGMATCGESTGAGAIRDTIQALLAELRIDAVLHKAGCLGMCYA
jgi:hypothetical protein